MSLKDEIEYKFLVKRELLPKLVNGSRLVQGYLGFSPTVRVRTESGPIDRQVAYITIKGQGLISRAEFEYDIPFQEAEKLIKLARNFTVSKIRYHLPVAGAPELKWEVDVFEGDNAGLITAELEVPSEDYVFERPVWIDKDVSADSQYKNAALARRPFKKW